MEKYKDRHPHVPTQITHYRRCSPSSPPRSSLPHTQKWLLVFPPSCWPSLASLRTQRSQSPEMIWPHQRAKIIHCASVGLFCIPDSQRDWIFHLHARLFSNVTHTSLKQHRHRPLASSIFPFWRFLFCREHEHAGRKQVREYSPCYFQPPEKKTTKQGFVLLTEIQSGLPQQGVDCHSILIQIQSHYRAPQQTVSNHQLCCISQQHQRLIRSPGNTQNEVLVQLVLFPNGCTANT